MISGGNSTLGIDQEQRRNHLLLYGANTYQGQTSVQGGVLTVLSLGNSTLGGASSVGIADANSTTDSGAVTLGNAGTTAASLQYVGSGEISDRKIRLNTTTGATQIHADGSGPLV